jgi:hypothetical protein
VGGCIYFRSGHAHNYPSVVLLVVSVLDVYSQLIAVLPEAAIAWLNQSTMFFAKHVISQHPGWVRKLPETLRDPGLALRVATLRRSQFKGSLILVS